MEFDYARLFLLYVGLTLFFTVNKVLKEYKKEGKDSKDEGIHWVLFYFSMIFFSLIEYLKIHIIMLPIIIGVIALITPLID